MSYEESQTRRALKARIRRDSRSAGEVRSGDQGAPGNKNVGREDDITGFGLGGFSYTNGPDGGFETNPGGA
jgi:hypothetical protein